MSRINAADQILVESLCFHAQQSVKKSIKAVLLFYGEAFPKTHNIKVLMDLLPENVHIDTALSEIAGLTDYAVTFRYPGVYEAITYGEYQEAMRLADLTLKWAEKIVR